MSPSAVAAACAHEANGTCETMPSHIWTHAVSLAAIRLGVPADALSDRDLRARMSRAYAAGEPMWMFVHELVMRHERPPPVRDHLRNAIADNSESHARLNPGDVR